ncbi:hypothetical protein ACIPVK_09665 [Paeniglutamicibacter sp. MACA_103]|uniref:hypothetical protein n=1 Tax=Paeniglutamicibacter sp. MACA_103 TaxID=3377337 RepID=UPI003893DD1B
MDDSKAIPQDAREREPEIVRPRHALHRERATPAPGPEAAAAGHSHSPHARFDDSVWGRGTAPCTQPATAGLASLATR